jgi:biopolymer transport protein ExbB
MDFFIKGGFFMIPLVLCSIISGAVIILRALALRRDKVIPPVVEQNINALRPEDEPKKLAQLHKLVHGDPSALGSIVDTAIRHLEWSKSENLEAVQTKARHEIVRLEQGLVVLEVLVGIAPLLGLLGTVSGLVQVFGTLGASTTEDPVGIARGIAEALNTTIAGLAIAIPSLIAYSYFSKKVETMAAEMESAVAELLSKCYSERASFRSILFRRSAPAPQKQPAPQRTP